MKINNVLVIITILIFQINGGLCFDPVSWSVGGIGIGVLTAGYRKYVCKFSECCNDEHVPINVTEFQRQLASRLYGQHIAHETVIRAIRGYKATENPPKALAISFHGTPGTGKNYISSILASTFFKQGTRSSFFQLFSGSTFSKSRLDEHKEFIKNTLVETLQKCERSLFVFDEVHKMPEGLLDILQPFLDYAQPIFLEYKSRQIRLNSNKAIFVFLTNASGTKILNEMLRFWTEGKKREELTLNDFENLIRGDAVEQNGGFLNSNAIKSSLIDYYVPFLPLEEEHIKLCMRDAFESDKYPDPPTPAMEEDVLATVIYGPSPYNIYATGGCKRLETKSKNQFNWRLSKKINGKRMATKNGNLDDFNFYLKLAKPLVLDLPDAKDRAMAALWLKKLGELNSQHSAESAPDNTHVECLKLLLLAMQADRLTGVFGKPPPSGDLSDIIPSNTRAQDMVSLMKAWDSSQQGDEVITYGHPRVVTSIGGDLCEYVAIQEIPNFGIHGYYALSNEPLSQWSNPRRAGPGEAEVIDCFKRASERAERKKPSPAKVSAEEQVDTAAATFGSDPTGGEEFSRKKHERTKHSEKSLQKIFQAQRSEIAGVETRPCWGRIRYIDRLIDESPHLVADLELSEADAMLHAYRDTKFRQTKQASKAAKASTACSISSRRRNVEKRLDLPPCAVIRDEEDYARFAVAEDTAGSRTCLPKNLDFRDCRNMSEDETIAYDRAMDDFPDDECESELLEQTEYDTWPEYDYECDEYPEQFSGALKESYSNISQPSMESMDPEVVRDAKRLIADPTRKEPPSSGKVKVPRRRQHSSVEETWNPPGHSTRIGNR